MAIYNGSAEPHGSGCQERGQRDLFRSSTNCLWPQRTQARRMQPDRAGHPYIAQRLCRGKESRDIPPPTSLMETVYVRRTGPGIGILVMEFPDTSATSEEDAARQTEAIRSSRPRRYRASTGSGN